MPQSKKQNHAGFWQRFIALVIDMTIVSILILPLTLTLGALSPNSFYVDTPFGILTSKQTIDQHPVLEKLKQGPQKPNTINTKIVEETILGLITYYKKVVTYRKDKKTYHSSTLIDINTGERIKVTKSNDIEYIVLFFYLIFLESSKIQGSIGKKALGIKVLSSTGNIPTLPQAIGRNILKLISASIFFIGFMMAGWTKEKQALHDKILGTHLIKEKTTADSQDPISEP